MTVEERAQQLIDEYLSWKDNPLAGEGSLKARFARRLRDQIEECAKKAEDAITEVPARNSQTILYRDYIEHNNALLEQLAYDIRALAADEKRLPTIEEMSGLVEDFTDGLSLKDYMEDLRR